MRLSGIALFLLFECVFYGASGDIIWSLKPQCGIHEKYNDCGTFWYCEPTCDQPGGQACPKICVAGCFCEENYIRKETNGTCICKNDCRKNC